MMGTHIYVDFDISMLVVLAAGDLFSEMKSVRLVIDGIVDPIQAMSIQFPLPHHCKYLSIGMLWWRV